MPSAEFSSTVFRRVLRPRVVAPLAGLALLIGIVVPLLGDDGPPAPRSWTSHIEDEPGLGADPAGATGDSDETGGDEHATPDSSSRRRSAPGRTPPSGTGIAPALVTSAGSPTASPVTGPSAGALPTGPAPAGAGSTGTGSTGSGSTGTGPTTATTRPATGTTPKPPGWHTVSAAPLSARTDHGAVWTGHEMVIWGGLDNESVAVNDGAAYDPATETWRKLAAGPLTPRIEPFLAWTGTEMLVWGGVNDETDTVVDAAAWNPSTDQWRTFPAPPLTAVEDFAAAWTGQGLAVWGGFVEAGSPTVGGAYLDLATGQWKAIPDAPIAPRGGADAVFAAGRLIVSGGRNADGDELADGAAWDPVANTWSAIAPRPVAGSCDDARLCPVLWTGTRALFPRANLAYEPGTDHWTAIASLRGGVEWFYETSVWTGDRMLEWGGEPDDADAAPTITGGVYDPDADRWTDLENAPFATRAGHSAIWTGSEMIIWGGGDDESTFSSGAGYRPVV